MAGFTFQQLTFITEKTIETKSPKKITKSFSEVNQKCYTFKKSYFLCFKNFYETGSIHIKKNPRLSLTVRTSSNIDKVKDVATAFPQKYLWRISQEFCISLFSTYKIMKKSFYLIPYDIRVVQQLLSLDYLENKYFAAWFTRPSHFDSDFINRILFSEEAYFHLNGVYLYKTADLSQPKT